LEPTESSTNPYAAPASAPTEASSDVGDAITSEGFWTVEEVIQAAILPREAHLRRVFAYFFSFAFITAAFAVQQWFFARGQQLWFTAGIFVGLFVICPVFYRAVLVLFARQAYDSSPLASEPFRQAISAEGVEIITPTSYSRVRWEAFFGYVVTDETVSLSSKHRAGSSFSFHRNHFVPSEWERFRKLVATKLPRC
jgi:hypothetical protein